MEHSQLSYREMGDRDRRSPRQELKGQTAQQQKQKTFCLTKMDGENLFPEVVHLASCAQGGLIVYTVNKWGNSNKCMANLKYKKTKVHAYGLRLYVSNTFCFEQQSGLS